MINIFDKIDCCGCASCVQVCPKGCISFKEDNEGFNYPCVDKDKCIKCGKCVRSCPMLCDKKERLPKSVLASINTNSIIRKDSSSGGVFSALSTWLLEKDGVVFGAKFNNRWEVVHDYVESEEDLRLLRGSKYVQSHIRNSFERAESFLKEGRIVLFSGTPCQIAGLKCYLNNKEYENLYLVDFVCHGVPSPKVWLKYIKEVVPDNESIISNVNFRSKSTGWSNFSLEIKSKNQILLSEPFSKNLYMRAFLDNLILRPSCHDCKFRSGKSGSDLTIADYWGIEEVSSDFIDNMGCSLVLVNTDKGKSMFDACGLYSIETTYDDACKHNRTIKGSWEANMNRSSFFKDLDSEGSVLKLISNSLPKKRNNIVVKIVKRLKSLIK